MNKITKIVLTLFFVSISLMTMAQQQYEMEKFQHKLEQNSIKNNTIKCDFIQTKKVKNIKDLITSEGKFYYDKNGKIALRYTEPQGDKIIIANNTYTIFVSGAMIQGDGEGNPMMQQVCGMLEACMSGDISSLGRGWQTAISSVEDKFQVVLVPLERRVKKYIESMQMIFDANNMTLVSMSMNETSGGFTEYVFENKHINEPIEDAMFE